MTPEQARALTEQASTSRDGVVGQIVQYAYDQIAKAAKEAKRSVLNPCGGLRGGGNRHHIEMAYERLKKEGYKVTYDGGNQREPLEEWTVSW